MDEAESSNGLEEVIPVVKSQGVGDGFCDEVIESMNKIDETASSQADIAPHIDSVMKDEPSASSSSLLKGLSQEDCIGLAARIASTPGIGESNFELFDVMRTPRWLPAPAEETLQSTARLSLSGLSEDLSCPICRGTYKQVMVVKDCLHRFCSECIERWLRSGRQDCPKCRTKIASRRALRQDPIFQAMIMRLFPDVAEFETRNDELIYEANKRRTLGESCASNFHLAGVGRGRTSAAGAAGNSQNKSTRANGLPSGNRRDSLATDEPRSADIFSPPSAAESESLPATVKEAVEAVFERLQGCRLQDKNRGPRKQRRLSQTTTTTNSPAAAPS